MFNRYKGVNDEEKETWKHEKRKIVKRENCHKAEDARVQGCKGIRVQGRKGTRV